MCSYHMQSRICIRSILCMQSGPELKYSCLSANQDKLEESQNSRAASLLFLIHLASWFANPNPKAFPRLRDQMKAIVTEMKAKYDDLTAKQAESVTATPDKYLASYFMRGRDSLTYYKPSIH